MDLPTPLERAPDSLLPGRDVWLKREDVHELGAFKWRGALAAITTYVAARAQAVVTASTGNHGAATAWAAAQHDIRAIVFVPEGASRAKTALIERHGAELRYVGVDLDAAKDAARDYATGAGIPFFEDGAEPAQHAGYAVIAHEIVDQLPTEPAVVVVPLGNGALATGIGLGLADRNSAARLVCVVSDAAPVMAWSLAERHAVDCDRSETFADGLAVRVAIPSAVATLLPLVDDVLIVTERELAEAVGVFAGAGIRVEGAAAAALAGARRLPDGDGPAVLLVTGRNIDDDLHQRAVDAPESFPAAGERG